jgi:replication factor C subunit 3/5
MNCMTLSSLEHTFLTTTLSTSSSHSDIGFYDRVVVQDLIKEIAQAPQLDRQARQRFKGKHTVRMIYTMTYRKIIVVVIHEADTLTRDAQTALRRTMEKYTANLRVILCCNTTSRVISPIRSRCLLIRVAAPQQQEASMDMLTLSDGITVI